MKKLTSLFAVTALAALANSATAAPPNAAFNGTVSEIFVNNSQVLIAVSGPVRGTCRGAFGPYNLTFNMSDPGAQMKFDIVMTAFKNGQRIAGYVDGCGSSNINRMHQVSVSR